MIYLFIAMVLYAVEMVVGSYASRNANTNLVAGLINAVSAVVPFIVAVPFISRKNMSAGKAGLLWAVVAGMLIALFSMALTKSYSLNKVGVVAPTVFGGAILLSTLLSAVIFKEKVSVFEALGLALLACGFGLIVYARATAS